MLDVAVLSVEAWKIAGVVCSFFSSVDDDCGASCCMRMCVSVCMHAWPSMHSECHARRCRNVIFVTVPCQAWACCLVILEDVKG